MRLLTLDEVAIELRKSKRTIERYLEDGLIAYHRVGRDRFVSSDDLDAFLTGVREPTARERTERARATIGELPRNRRAELRMLADRKGL